MSPPDVQRTNLLTTECEGVIVNILEYLPNLEGFKLLLVSKLFYRAVQCLKKLSVDRSSATEVYPSVCKFMESKLFKEKIQVLDDVYTQYNTKKLDHLLENCDHLKEMRITVCEEVSIDTYNGDQLTNLEKIIMDGTNTEMVPSLRSGFLYNLTHLDLGTIHVRDHLSLVVNSFTTSLRILKLCSVYSCELSKIAALPFLEDLTLITFRLQRQDHLYEIFKSTSLKKLHIDCPETSLDFRDLRDNSAVKTVESNEPACTELKHLMINFSSTLCNKICGFKFPNITNLSLESISLDGADLFAKNTSFSNLKHIEFLDFIENNCLITILKNSQFTDIRGLTIRNQCTQSDCDALSLVGELPQYSSLTTLIIEKDNLMGYHQLSSPVFNNLQTLLIGIPEEMEDLKFLAESKSLINLTSLTVGYDCDAVSKDLKDIEFISLLSTNETFKKLKEITYYFSDEDILHVKNSPILTSLRLIEIVEIGEEPIFTSTGFKILCEWDNNRLEWRYTGC